MAGKVIDKSTDKQQDYIIFLNQVLEICIRFKEKLSTGYKRLYFREKDSSGPWHGIEEEGWGNSLTGCVYDSIILGKRQLEIAQSDSADIGEDIEIKAHFGILHDKPLKGDNSAEKKVNEVLGRLKEGFADREVAEKLEKTSTSFFEIRRKLQKKKSVFHLKKQEIKRYLEKYYNLLVDFWIYYDAFEQKQDRDIFIGELLRLDSMADEESKKYQINFWAPIVLNKLQKVNDGVEIFFKQITENIPESRYLQGIYKQTLLIKAQHSFRWYIPGKNHELLHAAIAPFVEGTPSNLKFQVIACNPEEYDSYEGIGELRLGEKIIYEHELIKEHVSSRFSIAIMGDLHVEPIEELYRYVDRKIDRQQNNDLTIEFNIYTKNDMSGIKNQHIICHGFPKAILLQRKELERMIDANSIVFFLDCIELYKQLTADSLSNELIKQKYAFSSYDEYNTGLTKSVDVCDNNMMEELYEIVTCEQCFNKFGRIAKRANSALLKFCEQKQKERGERSALYVYVSDMKAFDNIYKDDQYYIRTERYKQKEIGILRYSAEKVTKLENGSNDKMLVFNIWQFIKIVAIEERNMFISFVNKSKDAYMDLDKIYIGIDYTTWQDSLIVHYHTKEKAYGQVAEKFIKDVLLPVLNNRSCDMFNTYIRRAMYSFFYSSAKNVNDMLFIHLFQDKAELLGKVVIAEKNDEEKVIRHLSKKFKYSSKRFYDMIMKNYDMSSNIYIGQMDTYRIIRKNGFADSEIDKNEIYRNVITACRNLSYDNGYLRKNCEREIGLK